MKTPSHQSEAAHVSAVHRMDMLFGMGGRLLYALSRLALPPLVLAHVSMHEYGLWSVAFVLVGYVGMTASGFANVYLRQVSRLLAQGDLHRIGVVLSTGIFTVSALCLVLYALMSLNMGMLLDAFRVEPASRDTARALWMGATAIFLADLSLGAFASTLHALGQIRQEQKIWLLACACELLCIVILIHAGFGIHSLLWAFAARYALSCALAIRGVMRALPGVRLSWRLVDPACIKVFVREGGGIQLADLGSTMLHSMDRVLSGLLIGPHAVAFFDLAAKLPVTAGSIASSVSLVTTSTAARQDAHGSRTQMQAILDEASRFNVAGLGLMLPFMAAMGQSMVFAWLGVNDTATQLVGILPLVCMGWHAHLLTGPCSSVFRGMGMVRPDFIYHLLRLTAMLVCVGVWQLAWPGHLAALAGSLAVSQIGAALCYLAWARGHLRSDGGKLWSAVLGPTLLAYGAAAIVHVMFDRHLATSRPQAIGTLLAGAMVWLVVMGALIWRTSLNEGERGRIRALLPAMVKS